LTSQIPVATIAVLYSNVKFIVHLYIIDCRIPQKETGFLKAVRKLARSFKFDGIKLSSANESSDEE
jgi:hypothetical protein